jgi:uncharacterized protein YebE (UPF0316 family)
MIGYVLLALIKIFDNIILTVKTIATYKEQKILSSILVIVSQLIFYLVIEKVIEDNTILAIIIVSISSGIGNLLAFLINNKFKHDTKWTFVITSSDVKDIKNLCNYLAKNKIKYIANDGYNRKGEHTINVMAFSKTKNDSRLIENYLLNSYEKTYFPKQIENAGKYSYIERNCEMIDNAKYCVFYYDENYTTEQIGAFKRKSGTKFAFEYAVKKKKEIINLYN